MCPTWGSAPKQQTPDAFELKLKPACSHEVFLSSDAFILSSFIPMILNFCIIEIFHLIHFIVKDASVIGLVLSFQIYRLLDGIELTRSFLIYSVASIKI